MFRRGNDRLHAHTGGPLLHELRLARFLLSKNANCSVAEGEERNEGYKGIDMLLFLLSQAQALQEEFEITMAEKKEGYSAGCRVRCGER